jgi:hypothetical protein
MSVRTSAKRGRRRWVVLVELVACLLVGAATWGAWLGWDHSYYYDAAVGAYQGPYRPAQVAACAVTVGVLTALLALQWKPLVVAAGITVGFWLPWTVQAGTTDESGLFVVGSFLLLLALAVGTSVAGALGYGLRMMLRRQRRYGRPTS